MKANQEVALLLSIFCLLLSLQARPAHAQTPPRPTTAEVKRWSPAQYNDFIVSVDNTLIDQVVAQTRAIGDTTDQSAFLSYIDQLKAILHEGRTTAALMPPYRGNSDFRDTVLQAYDEALIVMDKDMPRFAHLIFTPNVRNEDLAELEVLQAHINTTLDDAVKRISDVQAAFARRHRLVIIDNDRSGEADRAIEEVFGAPFSAPGLPPEGSVLDGDVHVSFALRYHNQMIDQHNRIIDSVNAVMDASHGDSSAFEDARTSAAAALTAEQLRCGEWGDWQGDDTLITANRALTERMLAMMEGDVATLTGLSKKAVLSAKKQRLHNNTADAVSIEVQDALADVSAQYGHFAERWHLLAYQAWQEQSGHTD